MKKIPKRYYLNLQSQESIKAKLFVKELWKRFDEVLNTLDNNDFAQQLWVDHIKIALNVHNNIYGHYPSMGFTEENVLDGFRDWGKPNIIHSSDNSALWFFDGFIISFKNGIVNRIDIEPGFGIHQN